MLYHLLLYLTVILTLLFKRFNIIMCRRGPMLRGTADRYGGTNYPIQSSWTICNVITFNHTRDRHSLAADRRAGLGSDGYEWYDNADVLAHHFYAV